MGPLEHLKFVLTSLSVDMHFPVFTFSWVEHSSIFYLNLMDSLRSFV